MLRTEMIYGIGIDIVKIQRIKDASEKWGRAFLKKIMTEREIAYCFEKSDPYPSLAVRFAAKEALTKAIGAEITFGFKDIEVLTDSRGRPRLSIRNRLEVFFAERAIKGCHVSLSHEKEYGVACVVLEG